MNKILYILIAFIFCINSSYAQSELENTSNSLQKLALTIQASKNFDERKSTNNYITQSLLQILKEPNSFNYGFDSLSAIKRIASPDGVFNIFTWQVELAEGEFTQNGILQLKISEDSLKLFLLKDQSDAMETPEKENCITSNWFGAIYYDIYISEFNGAKYYSLLGYDEYSKTMTQKVIEVIQIENNEPIFGGDYFLYPPDETYPEAPVKRFIYTYKKGSNALIKFEKESKAIVLSELTSIDNKLKNKSTLVPSGDEVFFVWKNGKWIMPNK
jgi:hypothetical protein